MEPGHAATPMASNAPTCCDTQAITARLPRPLPAVVWDLPRAACSYAKGWMLVTIAAAVRDTGQLLAIITVTSNKITTSLDRQRT